MVKKLASKIDKRLYTETEINQKSLNKADFSTNWNGRLFIVDPDKSVIAQRISATEVGEYAIKVR